MASTYSNLKIQLMATGENNTTWGNVTNDNLGVAIEEAIVGSADVTFASANVTLTLTDTNATQTARNMRLRCTGTTGGARNLIVPAIEKVYIVQNDCADAITIKNTTGTGIAVPAGKTIWVYNDATNVVAATTHLTSLTLASALPVASGGTGATSLTSGYLPKGNGTSAVSASIVYDDGASKIGVNTASPATTLDINGTFNVSGALTSGNLADTAGYKGLPQNSQTGAYTLALTDIGKHISITTGGVVIPANSSVAFPIGSAVVIFNNSGSSQTISITTDTLRFAGTSLTGSRTLPLYGLATLVKIASTVWAISGTGVS
jgi:hypothetical protein